MGDKQAHSDKQGWYSDDSDNKWDPDGCAGYECAMCGEDAPTIVIDGTGICKLCKSSATQIEFAEAMGWEINITDEHF